MALAPEPGIADVRFRAAATSDSANSPRPLLQTVVLHLKVSFRIRPWPNCFAGRRSPARAIAVSACWNSLPHGCADRWS